MARAIIDDILASLNLEEISSQLNPGSIGSEIVHMACSLLCACLAGERILRCWGGGTGWAVEDALPIPVGLLPTRDRNYYSITGERNMSFLIISGMNALDCKCARNSTVRKLQAKNNYLQGSS